MADQTCNGYTNWDTWILALYSDNTEWIYDQKIAQFDSMIEDEEDTFSSEEAKVFCENNGVLMACANEPEFDYSEVDWSDIAETWTVELKEHNDYYNG